MARVEDPFRVVPLYRDVLVVIHCAYDMQGTSAQLGLLWYDGYHGPHWMWSILDWCANRHWQGNVFQTRPW